MNRRSVYIKLEASIAADERGGTEHRFRYGRELLKARAGRQRLPKGFIADRINEAEQTGFKISEQEIQRRMRFAEVYPTEAHRRQALTLMGSWSAIVNAGFPPVEVDEADAEPDELDTTGISTAAPDEFEQLSLIPGFGPTLSVHGRKVPLGDATVADAKAYRDMYRQIHDNYSKRLALIEDSVDAMIEGSGGDDDANAVEAWREAHGDHDGDDGDADLASTS